MLRTPTATRPSGDAERLDEVAGAAAKVRRDEKKQRKRLRRRRRAASDKEEEAAALRFIRRWLEPDLAEGEHEEEVAMDGRARRRVVAELHAHSTCSDGAFSPAEIVERAHRNGVKILALTDHDTMAGVEEALKVASNFGIRIIPGVEISASCSLWEGSKVEHPVHILAYYDTWLPSKFKELEHVLAKRRDGRYARAKEMLHKLQGLDMPLKFEDVSEIAGKGTAPGRLHIAQAMVAAGYVDNVRQAFSKYLYDGGPAYASGYEPTAESVVRLVRQTGGVSALAHPWGLKDTVEITWKLKASGLDAIEAYRSDGKLSGICDIADSFGLIKIGGSDFHGSKGQEEPELGSVNLPVLALHQFLKLVVQVAASDQSENQMCSDQSENQMCANSVRTADEDCFQACGNTNEEETGELELAKALSYVALIS